jgi:hypothetical protein
MFPIILQNVLSPPVFAEALEIARTKEMVKVRMDYGDIAIGMHTPTKVCDILTKAASDIIGKELISNISFIRLNHSKTDVTPRIHSDQSTMGQIDVASVFYFETSEHGTALFEHPEYGRVWRPGLRTVFKDPTDWSIYAHYAAVKNSMLIYSADMWHSRWPTISYGDDQSNGRLVIVNFMRYRNKNESCSDQG